MNRPLSTPEVAELMVGTGTRSSLPCTKPTRSSFSNTAIRFRYGGEAKQSRVESKPPSPRGAVGPSTLAPPARRRPSHGGTFRRLKVALVMPRLWKMPTVSLPLQTLLALSYPRSDNRLWLSWIQLQQERKRFRGERGRRRRRGVSSLT